MTHIIFRVSRNSSLQILFTWILAVKASRWGLQTARTAPQPAEFASLLTQICLQNAISCFYYCKSTGLLSNCVLSNLRFVRNLAGICAGTDDNINTYRWRGSYRTATDATLDRNTQKSCKTTYLWISTVLVAPRIVHAPQKTNVSRCWMKTTSSTLPSRTPTVRITLPRNCLRTASGKFLIVTD